MKIQHSYDVAVIGASVAGSVLSSLLGRKGISVALIDKQEFPRAKSCGEGLSARGKEALERLGLWSDDEIKPTSFESYNIYDWPERASRAGGLNLGHRNGIAIGSKSVCGVGVSRYLLDKYLVSRALENQSVCGYFRSRVVDIIHGQTHYEIVLANGQKLYSKFLALCDGASSNSAKILGIDYLSSSSERLGFSVKAKLRKPIKGSKVIIFARKDLQLLVTPLANSQVNISVLASIKLDGTLLRSLRNCASLTSILQNLGVDVDLISTPIGAAVINSGRRLAYKDRALLIGDACENIDPIGGMGMSHAILSAEMAASALVSSVELGNLRELEFARYAKRHEAMVRPMRGFTAISYSSLPALTCTLDVVKRGGAKIGGLLSRAIHNEPSSSKINRVAHGLAHNALSILGAFL